MIDLYIYYQVRDADAAAMRARVATMQARLATEQGVAGQLKRRPQAQDGLQTWMEVYPATPHGFDAALELAAADAGLAAAVRHKEIFMDLPPCA